MDRAFAKVYILDVPYHIDRLYDYYIPPVLKENIEIGSFVTVPFGNDNRRRYAVVADVSSNCEYEKVKPVLTVVSNRISLDEELLGLCLFMKEHTLCTVGEAVHAIVPAAAFSKLNDFYVAANEAEDAELKKSKLGAKALYVYEFIKSREKVYLPQLKDEFGETVTDVLSSLRKSGLIIHDVEIKESSNVRYAVKYSLKITPDEAQELLGTKDGKNKLRSQKQAAIIDVLMQNGELDENVLFEITGVSKSVVKALLQKEIIEQTKEEISRNPYGEKIFDKREENVLSPVQKDAFEKISALYRSGEPKAALLYGVTGSGKTRVIISLIDEVIASGRGVIFLLPEISLTPQTIDLFCSYYGERVAVIHSSLSGGERFDTWKRIKSGKADIVIGTRSAVFAPVKNLGMIVLDEEQEHTYKSDQDPKYHARDIARFRANYHKALMLLASATPSLESYYKAETGVYTLVKLKERYGNAVLPEVNITDMRTEEQSGNTSPISISLLRQLGDICESGEQAVLFINRRGYNNFLTCKSCGEVIKCPNCSVALRHHTYRNSKSGYLVCHYCGYRTDVPEVCPSCSSENISFIGYGTQRIEEELGALIPSAKILRMDTDTTAAKFSYDRLLGDFRKGNANILLGTQMVTKGHDFPNVTLVGVLLADSALYLDDFRASERAFAMMTQVVGRAGRADKKGFAVIQTCNPDNEIIRLVCNGDYESFYEKEIKLRKILVFPPFCDIVLMTVSSVYEKEILRASQILQKTFKETAKKEFPDVSYAAFGPFEAPVYKLNGKFRMRMVVKCKLNKSTRALFARILSEFGAISSQKLSLGIDFNPSSL